MTVFFRFSKKLISTFILLCGMAIPALGQHGFAPKIDEILEYSNNKRYLSTDCFLTYNTGLKGFRCLHANISASHEAAKLAINRGTAFQTVSGNPGVGAMAGFAAAPASNQYIGTTFMMPAYASFPKQIVMSWYGTGSNNVVWVLEWCSSTTSKCSAVGQNEVTAVSAASFGNRTLVYFNLEDEEWDPNSSITINITRDYGDALDTHGGRADVENIRLDLTTTSPK